MTALKEFVAVLQQLRRGVNIERFDSSKLNEFLLERRHINQEGYYLWSNEKCIGQWVGTKAM
jgi:hypothetical protein